MHGNIIPMPTPTDDLLLRLQVARRAIGREWDAPFRSEVVVAIDEAIKEIERLRADREMTVAVLHHMGNGDLAAAEAAIRGMDTLLSLMGAPG